MSSSSVRASARWTSRLLPVGLGAVAGFVTYAFVARLCDSYLLKSKRRTNLVIALLVLYFVFLVIAASTYLRLLLVIKFDAGLVPLPPEAIQQRASVQSTRRGNGPVQSLRYDSNQPAADGPSSLAPNLELFYSKDVFVCESDGRPRWCPNCFAYKPDRAHHSSELNRCVYKMDHYCPWVGGMVAENSFKFFTQFNVYATLLCATVLGGAAYGLKLQINTPGDEIDLTFIIMIGLSGFFGLFTFSMAFNTLRFAFLNISQVDALNMRTKVYQLAVRVDRDVQTDSKFGLVTYPPPLPGETQGPQGQWTRPNRIAGASAHGISPAPDSNPPLDSTTREGEATSTREARDSLATRTFAILRTEPGENPWDLGYRNNFASVMGTNPIDWVLPIRKSPCTNHERTDSFYPLGPLIDKLRDRYGLEKVGDDRDIAQLRRLRSRSKRRRRRKTEHSEKKARSGAGQEGRVGGERVGLGR